MKFYKFSTKLPEMGDVILMRYFSKDLPDLIGLVEIVTGDSERLLVRNYETGYSSYLYFEELRSNIWCKIEIE